MTLALYGKSRRRKGALLTAALLAVIVATVGALGAITSAFAHSASITGEAKCIDGGWKVTWTINGDTESKRMHIDSFSVTAGTTSEPSPNPVPEGSNPQQATAQTTGIPSSTTWVEATAKIYWDKSDGSNRFPGSGYQTKTKKVNKPDCATIIIKKVVTDQADSTQEFKADVVNTGGGGSHSSGEKAGLVFSQSKPYVHSWNEDSKDDTFEVTEQDPGSKWSTWYWSGSGDAACPSADSKDWKFGRTASLGVVKNGDTKTVCFLNRTNRTTGNIQVHKYLPKQNADDGDNAPWQNQGNGQSEWTFTVYGSESDAQNGTNPIASFNQLGNNSPDLPLTDLWIKETGMPAGHQFFGWYIPDGDNNSGNDKCNQKPLDGTGLTTTAILKIDKSYWSTKGNKTGLFHICAYNKPQQPQTISLTLRVCKLIKDGSADTEQQFTITVGNEKFTPTITGTGSNDKKCKDYTYEVPNDSPTKSVTISETPPAGWAAPKYTTKNQTGSTSSEQELPEDGLALTIGQGTCFGQAGAAQASSNQNQTNPDCTVTIINNKPPDPAVQKVKASEGYSGGYAYWEIKVKNPFDLVPEVFKVFKIEDSGVQFVSVSNGTCTPSLLYGYLNSDFSDGSIVCKADAGKTMVVKVKRAVTPQCQETTVNNSVTVKKWVVSGWVDYGTAGGDQATQYDIPGDPAKCDKPGITKTLVENGSSQTTDPNAIAWLVTVTNPATGSNGTTQTVYIKDQNVTVVGTPVLSGGATCTPSSGSSFEADLNSANGVACSMPNSSSITFTVKPKPAPARTCEDQVFNNTAYLYIGSTTAEPVSAQGPAITLLGDKSLCKKTLKICKVVVGNGDGIVTSSAFNFEVRHASGSTGAGNIHNGLPGGALNASEPNPDSENNKNGAEACTEVSVPATATIEVVEWGSRPSGWTDEADYPKYAINGGGQVSGGTTTPIAMANQQGPVTVVFYNKEKPRTKDITVCKVLEDNGDRYSRPAGTFVLTVNDGSQVTQHALDAAEGGQAACKKVTVPANGTVTVGEASTRPTNWNGDADDYPKVTQDGNTYTVTNKEKPITVTVKFQKVICNSLSDVAANQNTGNNDDIGKPSMSATGGLSGQLNQTVAPAGGNDPVTPSNDGRSTTNCHVWGTGQGETGGWNFYLKNPGGTSTLNTITHNAGSQYAEHQLTQAELSAALKASTLRVEEELRTGYGFAGLKCWRDHLNGDNWEWLDFSNGLPGASDEVWCIAYNVPATKQITIQKKFYGASQVSEADYPTFTISDGVNFGAACTGPSISGTDPVTATWTCTVPYLWNGTVTETPATGWERCAVVSAQVAGNGSQTQETFEFTNCKQAQIIVKKVVTNKENDTTQFSVTLGGGQSSQTGQIAEWNVNATFSNLSLGTSYTVTESSQNGYQVLGWAYANNDGTCPPQPTQTGAAAKVGQLGAGETKTICFYNERFGNVAVDKQAPAGTVAPGTTFNWTIKVSVATGSTSSQLTLTDTLPAGFTYGSPSATSPLSCSLNTTTRLLTCTLPQGTGIGTYTVTIPTTVPTNDFRVCGETTNTVAFSGAGTEGTDSATVNIGCTASDGSILVRKVVKGQPGDTTQFTAELTGPGITGTATQPFSQQNIGFFLGLSAGTFTVSEQPKPGYTYLGWAVGFIGRDTVECPANPTGTGSASVTLSTLAPNAAICFYNEARVTIRVHKTLNVVGFTSNGQGWQFTLTGCGITPQTKTTDANGIAEFTDLPPAISCVYTVTETVQPGWTPQFVSQTAQPVAGGQVVTLEFLNIKDFNPPCTDPNDPRCVPPPPSTPTPTATPTTPGATPTPTTPGATPTPTTPGATPTPTNTPSQPTATPTNTPSQPTATPTNTPVTQVAGERTPGPGQSPTPLAPATGFGFGQGEGGMSLLLVFAGLVSLSLGLGFLALGRRNR